MPCGRQEVDEGVVQRLGRLVHRRHHALEGLRARHRQHVGIGLPDHFRLRPHAARDDHLAVLRHGGADGGEGLALGAVEEAAGVDDDGVGAVMFLGDLVALGAQARDDALAVDQRLGAAERHEGDARRGAAGDGREDGIGRCQHGRCLGTAGARLQQPASPRAGMPGSRKGQRVMSGSTRAARRSQGGTGRPFPSRKARLNSFEA